MGTKKSYISEFHPGQNITEFLAVSQAQRRDAKNGPYWQLKLMDCSGEIEARIWSPYSQNIPELVPEMFVFVVGQAALYRDQLQLNLTEAHAVDPMEAGLRLQDFLPSSAVPPEALLAQIEEILECELSFTPWKALCSSILKTAELRVALLSAPGAKTIHHAYTGGLLEHTLGVMRVCLELAKLYPETDKEVLLVGAFLHDIGKAFELSHGLSREYTDQGRLLGHIYLGLQTLEPFLQKATDLPEALALHLRHLLISHHGELEFGSPKRPKTKEAFILHYADNLDAKIQSLRTALPEDAEGSPWSEYQRTLGRYVFAPQKTPVLQHLPTEKPATKSEKQGSVAEMDSPLLRAMTKHTQGA